MMPGDVPDVAAPYICGARLHAGNKKDGGICPIAVGNTVRRLAAKYFVLKVADKVALLLSPHQLGIAVRGGLEATIHSL